MHAELVEKKKWISEARFLHALNYCMLLPGPEAQQLATYVGWLLQKTWGGIVAGAFFVIPSIFINLYSLGTQLHLCDSWKSALGRSDLLSPEAGRASHRRCRRHPYRGPLIIVTQFVGFLGAWNNPGQLPPILSATLGALVTTWATFVPCFLWIFLGGPHIE
jgi:Chromate transporter